MSYGEQHVNTIGWVVISAAVAGGLAGGVLIGAGMAPAVPAAPPPLPSQACQSGGPVRPQFCPTQPGLGGGPSPGSVPGLGSGSDGGNLPRTGPPYGILTLGGTALLAGGAAAVVFTRRRATPR
jgi:hypothetical protein